MPDTLQPHEPLFMEISRQEYWSGLPFPPPGDLLEPGIQTLFSNPCLPYLLHCMQLFAPGKSQDPLSMEFFRQEYWNGLPFPSPEDLPHPKINPVSFVSPTFASRFFTTSATSQAQTPLYSCLLLFSHSVNTTLWDPIYCSLPSFPVHHHLLELAQIHFHWVIDTIQLSHPPLLSPSPPAFNLS